LKTTKAALNKIQVNSHEDHMLKWGNRGKGFLKSPKIKFGGVNMTFNLNVKKLFFVT